MYISKIKWIDLRSYRYY